MNQQDKKKIQEKYGLRKLHEPIVLNQKLLKKQINTLSSLMGVVNNDIGDMLVGVMQVLEIFEWPPKGEYTIKVKIE
jgi:hypothetical protein